MPPSPLQQLQQSLREATITPHQIAANSLAHSNTNANHNVYGPFVCVRPTPSGTYQNLTTFSALQLKAASS